jgi:preprotein translocase subunit SecD
MNGKKVAILVLVIAIILGITGISVQGLTLGENSVLPVGDQIKQGLDLSGGVYVVLEAQTDSTGDELAQKMNEAKLIIEQRVNGLGVSEPTVVIEGEDRIRVELPGLDNTQEAISLIGQTAKLEFRYLPSYVNLTEFAALSVEDQQAYFSENSVIAVTGDQVTKSEAGIQENDLGQSTPVVTLGLNDDGAEAFEEATRELNQRADRNLRTLFIMLDGVVISSPEVPPGLVIDDGKAIIEGGFATVEDAANLAMLIKAGSLPVDLVEIQSSVIGPTLGLESMERSVKAALIGMAIIFLFMLIVYRVPGFVADLNLLVYICIVLWTMAKIGAVLTLPGIAGMILSIGMAVDANVVIFERIREEIRNGKTPRSAVDSGFKRALRTVLDANITTLIAGIVLYAFGMGPIKGFAVTLIIGLIASLITAVFLTRFVLNLVIDTKLFNSKTAFGVK